MAEAVAPDLAAFMRGRSKHPDLQCEKAAFLTERQRLQDCGWRFGHRRKQDTTARRNTDLPARGGTWRGHRRSAAGACRRAAAPDSPKFRSPESPEPVATPLARRQQKPCFPRPLAFEPGSPVHTRGEATPRRGPLYDRLQRPAGMKAPPGVRPVTAPGHSEPALSTSLLTSTIGPHKPSDEAAETADAAALATVRHVGRLGTREVPCTAGVLGTVSMRGAVKQDRGGAEEATQSSILLPSQEPRGRSWSKGRVVTGGARCRVQRSQPR